MSTVFRLIWTQMPLCPTCGKEVYFGKYNRVTLTQEISRPSIESSFETFQNLRCGCSAFILKFCFDPTLSFPVELIYSYQLLFTHVYYSKESLVFHFNLAHFPDGSTTWKIWVC